MPVLSKAIGLRTRMPRVAAQPDRAALVAGFRAELARQPNILDRVPAAQLALARAEFSALPEVAGEPLPNTPRRAPR